MQAFQSWKENCGKSRQNNPSCWCGIQSGRQTVKPQCAKSPQFLASDRSETSYSVHPSSSCAHPALFCQPRCTLSILFNNFDGFLALVSLLTWFMVCNSYLSNSYKECLATTQNYLDHVSKRLHYVKVPTTDVLVQLHCSTL